MRNRLAGSALLLALWLPGSGAADELIFKNGDRLSGKLVRLESGKIILDSAVLHQVTVPVDALESFTTEDESDLRLVDGTLVSARIVGFRAGSVRLAGDRAVPLDRIKEINPEEVRWHGKLAAGLTIERGDTDKQDANIQFDARRDADEYRLRVRLRYVGERSRSGGSDFNTTDRLVNGTVQYDHLLEDRRFVYGRLRAERDGLADLSLRTIAGSGIGYRLFSRSDLTFDTQIGPAWVHEDYKDDSLDTDYPAGVIRWDVEKALHESVSFFHEGEWVASLREFNDSQLLATETGLRIDLVRGWFTEAKVHWELDTEPASGKERQNTDFIFALGWGF